MKIEEIEKLLKNSKELTPSEDLKNKIMNNIENEKDVPQNFKIRKIKKNFTKKISLLVASFVIILINAVTFGTLYFENYETVYLDVNPSISMETNIFGVVNKVNYLNDDAKNILGELDLKGKKIEDSVQSVLNTLNKNNFLDDAEVYFSISSKRNKNFEKDLDNLCNIANKFKNENKCKFNINKQKKLLTKKEIEEARNIGLPPGKLRVIKEILALNKLTNKNYTLENLRSLNMKELKNILLDLIKDTKEKPRNENIKDKKIVLDNSKFKHKGKKSIIEK